MKFAIRDDDLNYFYQPEVIANNYKDIWNICPVSMSVVPFMKGNWPKNVKDAEERGPGIMDKTILNKLRADNTVYPIGENEELVNFIKEKIVENKIYLTIHAIYHRNEDPIIPQFSGNFGFGAEFYTTRDLTESLTKSIRYLEGIFKQKIEVFTPPQNLYSSIGLKAVLNNNLAICGDFPSIKSFNIFKIIGLYYFVRYLSFKLLNHGTQFPFPIINKKIKMVGHQRLQPGTDIKKLYATLDEVYNRNGVFVLSTHSYGFNYKMKNSNKTMGEVLKEVVYYAATKPSVEFINIKQIFE